MICLCLCMYLQHCIDRAAQQVGGVLKSPQSGLRSLGRYHRRCHVLPSSPVAPATFFINPEPLAGALTSHNPAGDPNPQPPTPPPLPPPSSSVLPGMTLHHYRITRTRQRSNDSCQWSLKSSPPFQLKLVTSFLGPTTRISFFFCCILFQGSQVLNRGVEGQCVCQVFTASPDNIRCQVSRPSVTELRSTSIWRAGGSGSSDEKPVNFTCILSKCSLA